MSKPSLADQRVDLEHLHVLLDEGTVEVLDQRDALLDLRAFEPEGEGHAAAVEVAQPRRRVDREGHDLLGGRSRDFLDVHAAFGRDDEGNARGLAVDQQREVEFARDVRAIFDVDAVDLLAGRAGLVRHQRAAEHLLGELGGFFHRLGQANAALLTGFGLFELALAAAAGVDLSLDDPKRSVELARRRLGFLGFQDSAAVRNRAAIALEELLRLIFMNVHGRVPMLVRFDRWCGTFGRCNKMINARKRAFPA